MIRWTSAARLTVMLAAFTWLARDANAQASPETAAPASGIAARGANSPAAALPEVAFRRRFAVCIGINGYQEGSGFSRLSYAGNDAIGVAQALLEQCGFDKVLLATDETIPPELATKFAGRLTPLPTGERKPIRDAAEDFFRQAANPDDVVVLYFAGHGSVAESPQLIAGDYDAKNAPQNVFPVSQVVEWITSGVRAQNKLVIMDACRTPADGVANPSFVAPGFQQTLTELGHRLFVMFGCDAGESSYEDFQLGHGRFSWALIEALRGAAFKTGEEHLLVTQLHEYVGKVFEDHHWSGSQHPMMVTKLPYPFAVAFREVPRPQPLNEYEWKDLIELRDRGTRELVQNQLERADSTFRLCLRIVETVPQDDASVKLEKGRIEAQRALALYRLGRSGAWEQLAGAAVAAAPDAGALAELDGYQRLAQQDFAGAEQSLRRAINRVAQADDIAPTVWTKLGVCQFHLQEYGEAQKSFATAMTRCAALGMLPAASQNLDLAMRCGAWSGNFQAVGDATSRVLTQIAASKTPDSTELADLLEALSLALDKLGRSADALAPAERAVAIRESLLGAAHPETDASYKRLGEAYRTSGRLHALLVGCTEYPNLPKRYQLTGPGNDVLAAVQLLTQRFGFPDGEIVRLVHVSDETRRPTRHNIEREFKSLAERVKSGDVVFVMFSGYTAQDEDKGEGAADGDIELDGLDETFLPEDVQERKSGRPVEAAIRDDEIRGWLDALCREGAHVFFVSDRGDLADTSRPVDPRRGSLMALYGGPPEEQTREHPMMMGGGGDRRVFGRIYYALGDVLSAAEKPLTYRELLDELRVRYGQWAWNDHPYAEGTNLDQLVLTRSLWGDRGAMRVIRNADKTLALNVGSLRAITLGSKFAVFPTPTEESGSPLGYVEVVGVTPTSCSVAPCAFEGKPAVDAEQFPSPGRCELVYAAMGDLKLTVAVAAEETSHQDLENEIRKAVESLATQRHALVRLAEGDQIPDVQISVGAEDFTLRWPHLGGQAEMASAAVEELPPPPVFGPIKLDGHWEARLGEALQLAARAINLRRLAVQYQEMPFGNAEGPRINLKITTRKFVPFDEHVPPDDPYVDLNSRSIELFDKDRIKVEVRNMGSQPVDVTILYVDSELQVQSYFPTRMQVLNGGFNNRLEPGGNPAVVEFRINDAVLGWEDVIVLATPGKDNPRPQNFAELEQRPASTSSPSAAQLQGLVLVGGADSPLGTPLGELLLNGLYGDATRSGYDLSEASNFAIYRLSWLVRKEKAKADSARDAGETTGP